MSRGIEIHYKLLSEEFDKVVYGYSGANINKQYEWKDLYLYDGKIEIKLNALLSKSLAEATYCNEIGILKECKHEWHEQRLKDDNGKMCGFFAVRAMIKIF